MKKRFKDFLDEYVKNKNYDLQSYINDLTSQWCNTGILEYELSSYESKDGNCHLFNYTLEELHELRY